MRQGWIALATLAMVGGICGCGDDCEELCEAQSRCPGVSLVGNCEELCDVAEGIVEAAGCEDEWDALVSCQLDAGNHCDPDPAACQPENEAYFSACPR